jgi:hypothetical protein
MMVFFAIDKPTQRNYSQCNINIVRGKGGWVILFLNNHKCFINFLPGLSYIKILRKWFLFH